MKKVGKCYPFQRVWHPIVLLALQVRFRAWVQRLGEKFRLLSLTLGIRGIRGERFRVLGLWGFKDVVCKVGS